MDVSNTVLIDSRIEVLGEAIGKSGKATKLSVTWCRITGFGEAALAAGIEKCPQFRQLDLSDNEISDCGVTALAQGIAKCSQLQRLSLHTN